MPVKLTWRDEPAPSLGEVSMVFAPRKLNADAIARIRQQREAAEAERLTAAQEAERGVSPLEAATAALEQAGETETEPEA